jgi:serine-type D-Ala-D-Ala carboxypeptidase (penicillin-binding protein 5/6)
LNYGFNSYRRVRVIRDGARLARARVRFHGGRSVDLLALRPVSVTIRRGEKIRTRLEVPDELTGPIEKGEEVGSVAVFRAGEQVRAIPLVTAARVPGAGLLRRLGAYLLIPAAIAVLALAAVWRRRKIGGQRRRVLT